MSERESRRGMSRASVRGKRTSRAGLKLPFARIHHFLRKGNYGNRFSADATVFLAAVVKYMTAEILYSAGLEARHENSHRTIPHHLQQAMHADVEIDIQIDPQTTDL